MRVFSMHEIDLHGYRFVEGKEKIISEIKKCWKEKTGEIKIIHGYHGHAFKDYIESEDFLVDVLNEGYPLTRKSTPENQNNKRRRGVRRRLFWEDRIELRTKQGVNIFSKLPSVVA